MGKDAEIRMKIPVATNLRAVIINDTEYMAWVATDLRAVIVRNLARIIEICF